MFSRKVLIVSAVGLLCGLLEVLAGSASAKPKWAPHPHAAKAVPQATPLAQATALAAPDDPPTVVSLTFDDGDADALTAASILQSHGMHGTFYLNSGLIGQTGKLTWAQAQQIAAQGNEIGGHTLTHPDLTTLSTADTTTQIGQDRQNILTHNLSPTDFAYPFGATNTTIEGIVKQQGYASGRLIGNLVTPTSCLSCDYGEAIPPVDPYAIRTSDSIKNTYTLQQIEKLVTDVEQHGGGWQPLVFHHVDDISGDNPYRISPATLSAFLDWLKTQPVTVQTVEQVMGTQPPPPPPPPSNVIQNPSLETVLGGKPSCFEMYTGGGTNKTTWTSITSPVHSGSHAERGQETSWTSGGAVLVSSLDSGGCAPAAQPGHTYTGSVSYQADHPVALEFYYHNSAGWNWWREKEAPASASWAQVSMTTPAVPAGADLLAIGLEMPSKGTFYMDDFALGQAS